MVKNIDKLKINTAILFSDIHAGDSLGLCPDEGVSLDNGGVYDPSPGQKRVLGFWKEFWYEWVPLVTKGEPFCVVNLGDSIDGVHHGSTTQITQNITTQKQIAYDLLYPIVQLCNGNYYHIRGTEAHVGKSAQEEEGLAKSLGAIPNEYGQHSRDEMWMRLNTALIHFSHHIGGTGSSAYESTAVYKELVEAFVEAGRWGDEPPDVVARAHRHRQCETRIATKKGYGTSLVLPGWQLKTPFTFRLAAGRAGVPQFGGYMLRSGDEEEIYSRFRVWRTSRPEEVKI